MEAVEKQDLGSLIREKEKRLHAEMRDYFDLLGESVRERREALWRRFAEYEGLESGLAGCRERSDALEGRMRQLKDEITGAQLEADAQKELAIQGEYASLRDELEILEGRITHLQGTLRDHQGPRDLDSYQQQISMWALHQAKQADKVKRALDQDFKVLRRDLLGNA